MRGRWGGASVWAFVLLLLLAAALPVAGQQGTPPSLRPYWHVFAAYAVAWALVLGWVLLIARRVARLEARFRSGGGTGGGAGRAD